MATSPKGFKGPFIVTADIEIKEGHADTFDREFRKVRECANSDKEPGCIEFRTSRHGNKFFAFEQYEDAAALKAHGETDVFTAFVGVVKDLHARVSFYPIYILIVSKFVCSSLLLTDPRDRLLLHAHDRAPGSINRHQPPVVLFYEELDNAPQPSYKSKI
ncbi:unnamed protein product [Rhizoctonia solani]|uniref:ABM domain-containing protein n=1 Tax=Rhizoctonia solani TaxID=456999 RepID=A0A8H3DT81_9AGAM|nr:unnamed protein product [Rhizoctonia solani]